MQIIDPPKNEQKEDVAAPKRSLLFKSAGPDVTNLIGPHLDLKELIKCVFQSKRTAVPVCKRTVIPITSAHPFRRIRTQLSAHVSIIC